MSMYKQIQEKFWQNDFVLELKPEEKYFYFYLITNTMTNHCGIYKLNMKVAELETGLTPEVIETHLRTFEAYGKIAVSKTSNEIMIMNWFKHNFKCNKKTIAAINKELKDVKDKEFLNHLYEICVKRQYPVEEIFKGIIISPEAKDEVKSIGQSPQTTSEDQEKPIEEPKQEELKVGEKMLCPSITDSSKTTRKKKRRGKVVEEIESYDTTREEDIEQPLEGITIATWNFFDTGGSGNSIASSA
ncbi:hypothetical protein [Clostridium thermarum]|uniref:hypothetical protein n=1 Tax=Clostridium thermarum TaxID=1716543 RepID=UPI0013D6A799|nr:hypothetical protein [Clostridium thermarum]